VRKTNVKLIFEKLLLIGSLVLNKKLSKTARHSQFIPFKFMENCIT